jgi:hypothetical protein
MISGCIRFGSRCRHEVLRLGGHGRAERFSPAPLQGKPIVDQGLRATVSLGPPRWSCRACRRRRERDAGRPFAHWRPGRRRARLHRRGRRGLGPRRRRRAPGSSRIVPQGVADGPILHPSTCRALLGTLRRWRGRRSRSDTADTGGVAGRAACGRGREPGAQVVLTRAAAAMQRMARSSIWTAVSWRAYCSGTGGRVPAAPATTPQAER